MVKCPLCERDVHVLSDHHLIPQSKGGRGTEQVSICLDCHKMIHVMFSNSTLASIMNSVEALQAHVGFSKYLRWMCKRPGDRRYRPRRATKK